MDTFGDDYQFLWESSMLLPVEELDSWGLEEALSAAYYDSSSPDNGAASSLASKNIVSERNRRKKLNERLFALRSVVPNISKMDKASIIKDAIGYIQELHEEEKRIKAEISELGYLTNGHNFSMDVDQRSPVLKSKKKRTNHRRQCYDSNGNADQCNGNSNGCLKSSPIEDLEMRVSYVGEKTVVVSLTCGKREGTMVKLCEIFESLKLKIITAHITAFSGRLLKTVFLEADEVEKDHLKIKIERVISSSG